MRAGALKSNSTLFFIGLIDKNPIALNVAITRTFPFSVKRMIVIFRRQRFFLYDHVYNFMEFTQIPALFLHQLELLLERFLKMKIKHCVTADGRLIVHIPTQKVLPNFFKFMRFMPFYRNLPTRNSHTFLNGGGSLSIVARIPRLRINVTGANGTRMQGGFRPLVCRSRSKGKDDRSRWYFTRHVNSQPMAGRYFYGLRNAHALNIA